jgi:hypothetical protein
MIEEDETNAEAYIMLYIACLAESLEFGRMVAFVAV